MPDDWVGFAAAGGVPSLLAIFNILKDRASKDDLKEAVTGVEKRITELTAGIHGRVKGVEEDVKGVDGRVDNLVSEQRTFCETRSQGCRKEFGEVRAQIANTCGGCGEDGG